MRRRWLTLLVPPLLGAAWMALPGHSYLGALGPTILAADEDGDGLLGSDELARSSPTLVSFHKLDIDEDGAIDEPELLAHLLAEDPSSFDGDHPPLSPSPHDHLRYSTDPKQVRVLRVLFEFMLIEVLSVDRRVPLPSDEQIRAAARTGSPDSDEARQVAGNLVAAYRAAGLPVPAFLAEVEPVMAEPGLREPRFMPPDVSGEHGAGKPPEQGRRGPPPGDGRGPPPEGRRPPKDGQQRPFPPPRKRR